MPKARKKRKQYTEAQRRKIMAVAAKESLTAQDVKKRFGVTPVTYYSWRKKTGISARRRRGSGRGLGRTPLPNGGNLNVQVRHEVRDRVRQILPGIVRGEVNSYLNMLFASSGQRRRRA